MTSYRYYGWVNDSASRRLTPAVQVFLCLMLGVYILEILLPIAMRAYLYQWLALSVRGLKSGFVWQPFTYLFLHSGLLHIILNGLVLYFIGPTTERSVGTRQFVILFLLSGVLGGLGWALITRSSYATCIGASGAVFGVLGAFAALYPNAPLTVLLLFVIPVTLPAWLWALILAGSELIAMLRPETGGIAYAAHLAGGLAGYVYTSVVFCNSEPFRSWYRRWLTRKTRSANMLYCQANPDSAEVDRLLEKVARQGLQSLSPAERETLERAAEERRKRVY
jgi:membrane associated rhomboid family serine protease